MFQTSAIAPAQVRSRALLDSRRCAPRDVWGSLFSVAFILAVAAYRATQRFSISLKFVIVGDGPIRATLQTVANSSYQSLSRPIFIYVK